MVLDKENSIREAHANCSEHGGINNRDIPSGTEDRGRIALLGDIE